VSQPNGYIKTWVKIQYKLKMCPINTSSSACENKNNPGVYHIFEIPKKGHINMSHPRGKLNIKLLRIKTEFGSTKKSKVKDPDPTLGQKSVQDMKSKTFKK
jgi:hypothetical protein